MDGFLTTWNTPGLQFGALPASSGSVTDHLATFGAGAECTDGGIVHYDDGAFVGQYQVWESCGGTESAYVVLATNPTVGGEHTFLTIVQAVTSADLG